jgi:hypothetical protein
VQDLGRVSITPDKGTEGYETRKEYFDRIAREEREQKAAEQKRIEAEQRAKEDEAMRPLREEARKQSERLKLFWSSPLDRIATFGVELTLNDLVGDYPLQTEPKDGKADTTAYRRFKEQLASRGVTLTEDGWTRLGTYLASLYYHRNISLADVRSWELGFTRLYNDLGVFQATGEVQGEFRSEPATEPAVRQEPAPALTMNDLMNVDAGTQEGRREAKRIADDLYSIQAAGLYQQWIDHIREKFGYSVTRKDADRIAEWFTTNNKSWLQFDNFNQVKRYLVSIHHWPESMLTREEKAILDIENLPRLAGESDFSYRKRAQALAR